MSPDIGQGVPNGPHDGSRAAATASKQSGGRGIDLSIGAVVLRGPFLVFHNRFYQEYRRAFAVFGIAALAPIYPCSGKPTLAYKHGDFMSKNNTIRTTDFEEFYDRNDPDNAGQLACLYRSVVNISDESFFETKEIQNQGKVTHHVIASSGDVLILTAKSYPAFVSFVEIAKQQF